MKLPAIATLAALATPAIAADPPPAPQPDPKQQEIVKLQSDLDQANAEKTATEQMLMDEIRGRRAAQAQLLLMQSQATKVKEPPAK